MVSVSPPNLSEHTCLITPKLPPPLTFTYYISAIGLFCHADYGVFMYI